MAWVVPAIAAVGEAAGTAAGAVGSTIGSAASALGSLFGGEGAAGAAEAAAGAAPEAAAAGGIVPEAAAAGAAPTAAAAIPESFLGTIGTAAQGLLPGPTGLANLGQGLQSFFTGGPEAAPGFVGPPTAWAGPGVTGPGFAGGFVQGLTGKLASGSAPSGATSAGTGVGQLVSFLNSLSGTAQMPQPQMGPIVKMGGMPTRPFTTLIPQTAQSEIETGPIMKLLAHL